MEQIPNNEQLERRRWLVANLETKGDEDPLVKETLDLWVTIEQMERQARNEPNYFLTIELARIFEEARWPGRANELLDLAAMDAYQFGDMETYEKMQKAIGA